MTKSSAVLTPTQDGRYAGDVFSNVVCMHLRSSRALTLAPPGGEEAQHERCPPASVGWRAARRCWPHSAPSVVTPEVADRLSPTMSLEKERTVLQFEILPDRKVLIVKPKEPLETADFERLSAEVDALIRERGKLKGVLVDAPAFPGWASFAAFSAHVTFVNMHHHQIERLALVSGAPLLRTAATAASALLSPEVRLFNDGENRYRRAFGVLATAP